MSISNHNNDSESSISSTESDSSKGKVGRPKTRFTEEDRKNANRDYYNNFKNKNKKHFCDICKTSMSTYSKARHEKSAGHLEREAKKKSIKPSQKSPQILNILSAVTGKDFKKTTEKGECMLCNAKDAIGTLESVLDIREYEISGMCKKCQDRVFKEESSEDEPNTIFHS
jgi:hypothetical protein